MQELECEEEQCGPSTEDWLPCERWLWGYLMDDLLKANEVKNLSGEVNPT